MDTAVFITVPNYVIRIMCSDLFVDLREKGAKNIFHPCFIFSPHFSTATVLLPCVEEEFYPREHSLLSPVKKVRICLPSVEHLLHLGVKTVLSWKRSTAWWRGEALTP